MDFDQESEEIKRLIEQSRNSEGDDDYKRRVRMGGDLLSMLNVPSAAEIYSGAKIARPDYREAAQDTIKGMENPLEKASKIASTLSAYQGAQKAKADSEKSRAEAALGLELVPQPELEIYKKAGYPVEPGLTRSRVKALGWDTEKALGINQAANKKSDAQVLADNSFITEIRKELNSLPTTKATQDIVASYSKIKETAKNPSAAGDMSLVYSFMKMLDPGSTVREGEFANAQNAGGVSDKVRAQYNNILSGKLLSTNQRADFLNQASSVYKTQLGNQSRVNSQYSDIIKKRGLDPSSAIINFEDRYSPEGTAAVSPSTAFDQDKIAEELKRRGQ